MRPPPEDPKFTIIVALISSILSEPVICLLWFVLERYASNVPGGGGEDHHGEIHKENKKHDVNENSEKFEKHTTEKHGKNGKNVDNQRSERDGGDGKDEGGGEVVTRERRKSICETRERKEKHDIEEDIANNELLKCDDQSGFGLMIKDGMSGGAGGNGGAGGMKGRRQSSVLVEMSYAGETDIDCFV